MAGPSLANKVIATAVQTAATAGGWPTLPPPIQQAANSIGNAVGNHIAKQLVNSVVPSDPMAFAAKQIPQAVQNAVNNVKNDPGPPNSNVHQSSIPNSNVHKAA